MINWRRYSPWVVVGILLFYQVRYGLIPAWDQVQSDFPNYYVSAKLLVKGYPLTQFYDYLWFNQRVVDLGIDQQSNFGTFPPISAIIMIPLTPFSPLTAKRIWTILNILFGIGIVIHIKRLSGWSWAVAITFLLASGSILASNFRLGQVYLLILYLLFLIYRAGVRRNPFLGGSAIGFLTVFKYFPLFTLVAYSLEKNYRMVVAALISIVLLLGIEWIISPEAFEHYYGQAFPAHLSGDLPNQGAFAVQYQSWNSLLNYMFVYHQELNPSPVFTWPVGRKVGIWMIYLLVGSITGYLLMKVNEAGKRGKLEITMALTGITLLTLLPASGIYHFLFLPFCLIMLFVRTDDFKWILIGLYAILGFLPYSWLYSDANPLLLNYPRLCLINLIMVITWISVFRWTERELPSQ